MHFTFGAPYALGLLILLPCFLWCKPAIKSFYFPKTAWLKREAPLLTLEPWLKISLFTLMVFALAKPFVYDASSTQFKKGRDLILALDASGSMAQSGFNSEDRFKTKYDTMLSLSQDFIATRHDDNMGVVLFGTFAYSASPLTYDLPSLSYLLDMTTVGLAGESTAIGDAIAQATRSLSFGQAKNKAIILITDGYHNAGRTSPEQAVKEAKSKQVKIYTIGIGKRSDYDRGLLQKISDETGARSFSASTASELSTIYKEIDILEPSPIRSESYLNQKLLIIYPLGIVFFLLLVWVLWQMKEQK
jgi:Ca-activated chloride channel family protein